MFFVSRPSLARIEQFLKESADLPLSYSPVGLAAQSPAGFTVGESVVTVGQGRAAFDRAESALQAWRHYDIGWVELFPRAASVKPGSVVAVLIRHLGIWSLNGCRVLYTLGAHGSGESYGFAYGTLTNHAESGEEVFEIARDPRSDEVTYRIRGVARPQSFLARAGQPIVRLLQAKFRRDSGEAFRAALNGGSR